jgi:hypothetical protein
MTYHSSINGRTLTGSSFLYKNNPDLFSNLNLNVMIKTNSYKYLKLNGSKILQKFPVTIVKYNNGRRVMRILDRKTLIPIEIRELK